MSRERSPAVRAALRRRRARPEVPEGPRRSRPRRWDGARADEVQPDGPQSALTPRAWPRPGRASRSGASVESISQANPHSSTSTSTMPTCRPRGVQDAHVEARRRQLRLGEPPRPRVELRDRSHAVLDRPQHGAGRRAALAAPRVEFLEQLLRCQQSGAGRVRPGTPRSPARRGEPRTSSSTARQRGATARPARSSARGIRDVRSTWKCRRCAPGGHAGQEVHAVGLGALAETVQTERRPSRDHGIGPPAWRSPAIRCWRQVGVPLCRATMPGPMRCQGPPSRHRR